MQMPNCLNCEEDGMDECLVRRRVSICAALGQLLRRLAHLPAAPAATPATWHKDKATKYLMDAMPVLPIPAHLPREDVHHICVAASITAMCMTHSGQQAQGRCGRRVWTVVSPAQSCTDEEHGGEADKENKKVHDAADALLTVRHLVDLGRLPWGQCGHPQIPKIIQYYFTEHSKDHKGRADHYKGHLGLTEVEKGAAILAITLEDPLAPCGGRKIKEKLTGKGIHIPCYFYSREFINNFQCAVDRGVSLWLWEKITQQHLNQIMDENCCHKVHKQRNSLLPTGGRTGDFYKHPESLEWMKWLIFAKVCTEPWEVQVLAPKMVGRFSQL
ncbi:hypothetical protein B0H10DRAFT_1949389 [Mycena sp. CBHHK59/15]|nr:hypothetical protein B0H10DRAFT_1949389 [Mycena sp. CBHHK59/15]